MSKIILLTSNFLEEKHVFLSYLQFQVFQTMQVDQMVMFDHTMCTFWLKAKALKDMDIF